MLARLRLIVTCAVLAALGGLFNSASVPLSTAVVAKDVLLQADGKIVVSVETPATDRFTVVRLRPDGSLDPAFGGGDGIAELIIEPTRKAVVKDLALQPDGRIIASGHVMKDQSDSKFVVVRLRSDGSPDPTFSGDGKVITDFVTRNGWNRPWPSPRKGRSSPRAPTSPATASWCRATVPTAGRMRRSTSTAPRSSTWPRAVRGGL